jgi:hypothetical protein
MIQKHLEPIFQSLKKIKEVLDDNKLLDNQIIDHEEISNEMCQDLHFIYSMKMKANHFIHEFPLDSIDIDYEDIENSILSCIFLCIFDATFNIYRIFKNRIF